MAEQTEWPTLEECRSFAQKLGKLRESLPAKQQHMLDMMVVAAFTPTDGDDVHPYSEFYGGPQFVPTTSSPNPAWYTGSGASAWNQTPWGTTIGGLQGRY